LGERLEASAAITDNLDPSKSLSYTYDALARWQYATAGPTRSPTWKLWFVYDRYGNRTNENLLAGTGPSGSNRPGVHGRQNSAERRGIRDVGLWRAPLGPIEDVECFGAELKLRSFGTPCAPASSCGIFRRCRRCCARDFFSLWNVLNLRLPSRSGAHRSWLRV
jgi:hypothetical protein